VQRPADPAIAALRSARWRVGDRHSGDRFLSGSHYPLVNASDGSPVFNAGRGFNGMQTGLGAGCIAVAITSAGLPIAHAMGGNWTTTMNLGTPIGQVYSGTDPSKLTDYTTVLRLK
jgi:hypothetical protein